MYGIIVLGSFEIFKFRYFVGFFWLLGRICFFFLFLGEGVSSFEVFSGGEFFVWFRVVILSGFWVLWGIGKFFGVIGFWVGVVLECES